MLTLSTECNQALWGNPATNPGAIGTTRKPPERSSRLNITLKQCRLQVHPTVLLLKPCHR